jgi:hypothetical protein
MIRPFNPPSLEEEEKEKVKKEAKRQVEFRVFFDRPQQPVPQPEEKKEEHEDIDLKALARKTFEDAYIEGEKAGKEMG